MPGRSKMHPGPSRRFPWSCAALLIPQPIGSFLYLVLMRAGSLAPGLALPVLLQVFPLAALVCLWRGKGRGTEGRGMVCLAVLAVGELLWGAVVLTIVGIAMAWRLGAHE